MGRLKVQIVQKVQCKKSIAENRMTNLVIAKKNGYSRIETINLGNFKKLSALFRKSHCCNAYVEELEKYHISISMTEDYKPTDNTIAERVNGILKQELIYHRKRFASHEEAYEAIERFITFYNDSRPHMSIDYQTPSVAHQQVGTQQRHWKGYQERCQQI